MVSLRRKIAKCSNCSSLCALNLSIIRNLVPSLLLMLISCCIVGLSAAKNQVVKVACTDKYNPNYSWLTVTKRRPQYTLLRIHAHAHIITIKTVRVYNWDKCSIHSIVMECWAAAATADDQSSFQRTCNNPFFKNENCATKHPWSLVSRIQNNYYSDSVVRQYVSYQ